MSTATKSRDVNDYVETIDWSIVSADLDAQDWAVLPKLLSAKECDAIAGLHDKGEGFRSQVIMARHGFGRGHRHTLGIIFHDAA